MEGRLDWRRESRFLLLWDFPSSLISCFSFLSLLFFVFFLPLTSLVTSKSLYLVLKNVTFRIYEVFRCVCFQILGLFLGEEQILCCWLLRDYAILCICTTSSILCVDLFASFGIYWMICMCRPVSLFKSHKICSSLEFLLYTKYLHAQSCLTSRALTKIK